LIFKELIVSSSNRSFAEFLSDWSICLLTQQFTKSNLLRKRMKFQNNHHLGKQTSEPHFFANSCNFEKETEVPTR
jgi:hypothetical protein